jgi:lambda family phage portal protein
MNWWLKTFAPGKFLRLQKDQIELESKRARLEYLRSLYEGASRKGRAQNFRALDKGPIGESVEGRTLRDRARFLYRNDGTARRAVRLITAYTVGTGIHPVIKDRNGNRNETLQAIFDRWANSSVCDRRRRHNFYGLQRLHMRTCVRDGESLVVKKINPELVTLGQVPLQILIQECDVIDSSKNDDKIDFQGIRLAEDTAAGYWIYQQGSPADSNNIQSQLMNASDFIHMFEEERAGQIRGISWLAPAIMRLRDIDQYADAELMRRKVAACFSAFVTNSPDIKISDEEMEIFKKIEPGAVEFLSPGQDVKFSSPPNQVDYEPYMRCELQRVASGIGVQYEHLSGNLRDVNFSSARIGQIPFRALVEEWQYLMMIPQTLDRIWNWFVEAAVVSGVAREFEGASCEWIAPRIPMLDVEKETEALKTEVRSGFISLSGAIRETGRDPDVVLREISDDQSKLQELGVVLDSDAGKTSQAGRLHSDTER